MSAVDRAQYRALRAEGWRPADAVRQARHPMPQIERADEDAIHVTVDGWSIAISAEHDVDHKFELGTFSDKPGKDAVRVSPHSSLGWGYFHPQTSYEAHRAALNSSLVGKSRHEADCLARKYVQDDMLTQLGVIYTPWIITVVASLEDVDFGFAGLGGVTLGRDGITIKEVLAHAVQNGLVAEAIAMASAKLDQVVASRQHLRLVPSLD